MLFLQIKFCPLLRYSTCLFFALLVMISSMKALQADSLETQKDSLISTDTVTNFKICPTQQLLKENFLIKYQKDSQDYAITERVFTSKNLLFYFLTGIFLSLGIFRMMNNRYFLNILKVFFNNTLRQSQLKDQLLQAKLPSLFMNLFFVAVAGFYIFLSAFNYHQLNQDGLKTLLLCMAFILMVYTVKFVTLKFFGWLLNCRSETDNYIFIVFLFNKILGIILLPMTLIMAFADSDLFSIMLVVSGLIFCAMFMLRYIRTYRTISYSLKVSCFHFALYVTGIEILPILLIYKQAILILNKNM